MAEIADQLKIALEALAAKDELILQLNKNISEMQVNYTKQIADLSAQITLFQNQITVLINEKGGKGPFVGIKPNVATGSKRSHNKSNDGDNSAKQTPAKRSTISLPEALQTDEKTIVDITKSSTDINMETDTIEISENGEPSSQTNTNNEGNTNNNGVSNTKNEANGPENIKGDNPVGSDDNNRKILTFADVAKGLSGEKIPYGDLIKTSASNPITNRKIPPIEVNISDNEQRTLVHSIAMVNMDLDTYSITNNKTSVKFNLINIESHNRLVEVLYKNEIQFHTFGTKEVNNKAFIMRGLPTDYMDPDELKQVFTEGGFNIISCVRFETGYTRSKQTQSNLWKLIFDAKTTLEDLTEIQHICNSKVKFEPMKRKGAIQCKNCQGFLHTASNCYQKYKCVKCGKNHDVGKCTIMGYNNKKVKCANCGKNHTANNLSVCEYFINNILPLSKKNEKRSTDKKASNINKKNTNNGNNNIDRLKNTQPNPNNKATNSTKQKDSDKQKQTRETNQLEEQILNKVMQKLEAKLDSLFKNKNNDANSAKKNKKKKKKRNVK